MKVRELIEKLKEFDGELEVCLGTFEQTEKLHDVRIETADKHCYDEGVHVLEGYGIDKCLMLADWNTEYCEDYDEDDE